MKDARFTIPAPALLVKVVYLIATPAQYKKSDGITDKRREREYPDFQLSHDPFKHFKGAIPSCCHLFRLRFPCFLPLPLVLSAFRESGAYCQRSTPF
jgi:hypothetical protein